MINNVTLVGRLTRDPELRFTSNGTATANFNLAVNRNFTNQSGEREADFVNCVIWRKPAEGLANYAKKGTLIGLVGRIQTRNYENQKGQKVYVTEVVCDNFQLLEKRDSSESQSNNSVANQESQSFNQNNQANNDMFGGSSQIDINDDDLPF
ncbi:single-stranded DNA-binding protein [Vagococcus fluvialis]|uniref:single-stranded DNA-binding protein n=1 Tax=Vagococcus fluvialis TaxID=2738 RepID=UPI001D0BC8F7|nr:single-stranded DNA-binding protein [Vagococcus fluvialis]UDM72419.1 single-stranded DNA-binding protein [Vagococcus fluvialis]UDM77284.1 single-stranded DNA-binding protein [Vagococcus fluvialis]UDM81554.1 single-stranded DNA-binding protein [Vagococcus fluvialis]